MVKIRINKKKIVESAPALSGVGLFKVSGEWFIASTESTSPLQEHLILVNPSIFLEIIKKEKNLYLNFNKDLACRVSKKIVEFLKMNHSNFFEFLNLNLTVNSLFKMN